MPAALMLERALTMSSVVCGWTMTTREGSRAMVLLRVRRLLTKPVLNRKHVLLAGRDCRPIFETLHTYRRRRNAGGLRGVLMRASLTCLRRLGHLVCTGSLVQGLLRFGRRTCTDTRTAVAVTGG